MNKRKHHLIFIVGCMIIIFILWLLLRLFGQYPYIIIASVSVLLGIALFGFIASRLLARFAPRYVASKRLDRFIRKGDVAYVIRHDASEDADATIDPLFHATINGHDGLARLHFSPVQTEDMAAHLGEDVLVILPDRYGHTTLRFIGTLVTDARPHIWQVNVWQVELSHHAEPFSV